MHERQIFAIERPHPKLMTLYFIRSLLTGPLIVISLPVYYFRYHTMRYRFDAEGVSMRWGLLFRHEINLTYSRIQDIHVTSGLLQRWLGLADLQIQTASGSAAAEMALEGLLEYDAIRDFLYTRMRGYRDRPAQTPAVAGASATSAATPAATAEELAVLGAVLAELRAARQALDAIAGRER